MGVTFEPHQVAVGAWQEVKGEAMLVKVTGDRLQLEIFTNNKLFVSPQGKQL